MDDSNWNVLLQRLYDGVEQEGWVTRYNVLLDGAKKVGTPKVGRRPYKLAFEVE